ncbi:MAG: hypothetical protein K6G66_00635 [Oscillospiraceae bacterium]|nr:hypothetical protein [Oscillospiraceae bacterium]
MKRIIAILTAAVMLSAFCLGAWADTAVDGEYTLFAIEMAGEQKTPESMGLSSVLTLAKDGTGLLSMAGMEEKISKWEAKDGTVTLYSDEGIPQDVRLRDGIIEMEMGQGLYLYYAAAGVDTTGFTPENHAPDSKLYAVFHGIDAKKGAHLDYEYHSDFMDSTSIFDVHEKDGKLFSLRTTKAGGYEQLTATAFLDGTSYVLYPNEKRGNIALSTSLSLLKENILLTDELYKTLYERAMRTDYQTGTRELEGVSYTAEVYPAQDYTAEAVCYFDDAGNLIRIVVGAPVVAPQMGETVYTVHGIDDKVDETLFDISGYTISQ